MIAAAAAEAAVAAVGNVSGKKETKETCKQHIMSKTTKPREREKHTPIERKFPSRFFSPSMFGYKILPLEWIYVYAENFFNFVS